jgi:hypothetical protein
VARDETNCYKARQSLLGQCQGRLPFQNAFRDTLRCNWMAQKPLQPRRDPNMMDIDMIKVQAQAQRTYPSPQLHKEQRHRGQCMQCGQTGHIMKTALVDTRPSGTKSQQLTNCDFLDNCDSHKAPAETGCLNQTIRQGHPADHHTICPIETKQ